jgi:hypothetical protein
MFNHSKILSWSTPAAAVEAAATGLVLIISPPLFAWLIFGATFSAPGEALARLAGIALLGVALPAWPASPATSTPPSVTRALLIYNVLATIYLAYLGLAGQLVGVLLWPAVALHVLLSILLGRTWLIPDRSERAQVRSVEQS